MSLDADWMVSGSSHAHLGLICLFFFCLLVIKRYFQGTSRSKYGIVFVPKLSVTWMVNLNVKASALMFGDRAGQ
jgi:hypothetical protein